MLVTTVSACVVYNPNEEQWARHDASQLCIRAGEGGSPFPGRRALHEGHPVRATIGGLVEGEFDSCSDQQYAVLAYFFLSIQNLLVSVIVLLFKRTMLRSPVHQCFKRSAQISHYLRFLRFLKISSGSDPSSIPSKSRQSAAPLMARRAGGGGHCSMKQN